MADIEEKHKLLLEWFPVKETKHFTNAEKLQKVTDGEVWWVAVGENVGVEINGKSEYFSRPVLVFKKLSHLGFMGIPLSTQKHSGSWYIKFRFQGKQVVAALSQAKVFSTARLYSRLGQIAEDDMAKIKDVNRGYWDPEESTRTKWTATYAAELDARNLTHDFTGLSELLLGQAQPAQFQSAEQTGYWWGSKVSDDGNYTELQTVSDNSSNSEIPRAYHKGNDVYGDYYNWYAATAESGQYYMHSVAVEDSLCPSGWRMVENAIGDDEQGNAHKSWTNLLAGAYGLLDNTDASSEAARAIAPLSLTLPGYYSSNGALRNQNVSGHYMTPRASSASYGDGRYNFFRIAIASDSNSKFKLSNGNGFSDYGYSLRCVKK